MNKYGFLFDIDGCITPKESSTLNAKVDKRLIPYFRKLTEMGHIIAFVTGRSYPFIQETAPELLEEEYLLFFEYGWTHFHNNQHHIDERAKRWRDIHIHPFREKLASECQQQDVLLHPEEVILEPDDGAAFVEKKYAMISVLGNDKASPEEVHRCVRNVIPRVFSDQNIRTNPNHIGMDILLPDTSKRHAAQQVEVLLDPNQEVQFWYVFGDNAVHDKEMCLAFEPDQTEFIHTKDGASSDVINYLTSKFPNLSS